ncbi:folylpolyglutamate synthase [Aspergillus vadensis CBS 113365]|uniref:Folylpolyglutamate synthase n=1 Tax=Aspergillus vadensis (strain CBS 113365 / IMI 142717 / IBT 24658) TaxID=1448311 RepID=A0A319CGY9_ASPVC|nr:folylpolyglutamate synthase [Aspergillus vadensis CBS 113365]PYH74578.1 folylpolyglutamate synthase [Aspergillus vadensis CBS 113365]
MNQITRTYEQDCLSLLETRRRRDRPRTNPSVQTEKSPANVTTTVRGIPCLYGMSEWLQTLGHPEADISRLNIIHVTGTKGKGSTCEFTRSILHAHGSRTGFPSKIGLYTSPHIQCIRERIQINNNPVTENLFSKYFFEVWDTLMNTNIQNADTTQRPPRYLQFLALLAFHTFIRENVDAAIIEVHHGGEFDATNVIQNPVVTGITSLGLDHLDQLGPTVESIAWHKSGIFKPGAPAFSLPQEDSPSRVLHARAAEKNTSLTIVPLNPNLPTESSVLGIPVQQLNCSLALELARTSLKAKAPDHVIESADISTALRDISLIGRFEIIDDPDGQSQWFVDGAHNTLSLEKTAEWFSDITKSPAEQTNRILIFSHFSKDRDGLALLECLAESLSERDALPDHVIFTTYIERADKSQTEKMDKDILPTTLPDLSVLSLFAEKWKATVPRGTNSVSTKETIQEAIETARSIGAQQDGKAQVLITGCFLLVGGALNILRRS